MKATIAPIQRDRSMMPIAPEFPLNPSRGKGNTVEFTDFPGDWTWLRGNDPWKRGTKLATARRQTRACNMQKLVFLNSSLSGIYDITLKPLLLLTCRQTPLERDVNLCEKDVYIKQEIAKT